MEAKAIAKCVRMSPSKLKPVVDLVRGKDLNETLIILKFTPGRGAEIVEKVVKSAAANADVKEMDEETMIWMELGKAQMSGDVEAYQNAVTKAFEYKNRHIKNLEDTNKSLKADNHALADGIFTWENRKQLNALIRNLAKMANIDYPIIWNLLYRDLGYKFDIYPKLRNNGRKPYLDNLYEEEYPIAIRVFAAICEMYGFTFDQVATNCGFGINSMNKAKGA